MFVVVMKAIKRQGRLANALKLKTTFVTCFEIAVNAHQLSIDSIAIEKYLSFS